MTALLDTSVFIALEQERPLQDHPNEAFISVATTAELHLGVVMADDGAIRARRLRTLGQVLARFQPLPVTDPIAGVFAEVVGSLRRAGRRISVMDGLIAATALEHQIPLYTQDRGFLEIAGLEVHLV